MKVLSLFDGMSCGQIALNRIGVKPEKYYASELDKHAIKVTQANYPDTIQLGDVTAWREWDIDWASIGLLIGGSPCQGFSSAGKQLAFDDPRSALFFVYVDILNHIRSVNPDIKFMLENVRMKKSHLDVISENLNVEPVAINSALLSAQNRNRYYWANWDIEQPSDAGVLLCDILEPGVPADSILSPSRHRWLISDKGRETLAKRYASIDSEKAQCLTARSDASWNSNYVTRGEQITRLTPIEYERLQTVWDNYTAHVSNAQRYRMLGNGFTVEVISHILSCNDWTVDVVAHIFSQLRINNNAN